MTLKAGGGGCKDCPLFDITHLQEKRKYISNKKKVISTPTTKPRPGTDSHQHTKL